MLGLRVMRGPDWRGGDTDGGEGYVGTLIQLLGNHTVRVLWDMGQESTCSAGSDGKLELRVFDTAQIGVHHPNARCADCGQSDFYGMLWRCRDCAGCDLCPLCYNDDKHDLRHRFLRIDTPGTDGQPVPKRKTSVRSRAIGMFPGSKVTRGKDWQWGDQDGGQGSEGEVICYENVSPDSSRNLVRVQWSEMGAPNTYRLGFHGNVDLTCVEEEVGPFYYRDHLPLLDTTKPFEPKPASSESALVSTTCPNGAESTAETDVSSTHNPESSAPEADDTNTDTATSPATGGTTNFGDEAKRETQSEELWKKKASGTTEGQSQFGDSSSGAKFGGDVEAREGSVGVEEECFAVGDKVAVKVSENVLVELQDDYGGCTESMIKALGYTGEVVGVSSEGAVSARFQFSIYKYNPRALMKVSTLKEGTIVRIREDEELVKLLNCRVGWKTEMQATVGKTGRVLKVDSDGDVLVSFGRPFFLFAPASCIPAPDLKPDSLRIESGGQLPQIAVQASLSDGKSISSSESSSEWSKNESQALYQMLREKIRNESRSSEGRRDIVALLTAVKAGDHVTVREMCLADRSLLEKEHREELTPLVLACVMGTKNRQVVTTLLELGANVNHGLPPFKTPLVACMQGKSEELVELLLEAGADQFAVDQKRRTYIHHAAEYSLPKSIRALVARGVDVNIQDDYEDTALHYAIEHLKNDSVAALVELDSIDLRVKNKHDFPALHLACFKGNARAVELILERDKSQVNEMHHGKSTPLHIAANNDHDECIRVLVLQGGADLNIQDTIAVRYAPIHLASFRAKFRAVEALLEMGADLQLQDKDGDTPLHLAIGGRIKADLKSEAGEQECQLRLAIACMLISNGAYVDVENRKGRNPLTYGVPPVKEGVKTFMKHNPELVKRKGSGASFGFGDFSDGAGIKQTALLESLSTYSLQGQRRGHMKEALKGVGLPCGVCGTPKSDVTLHPCEHKCVCSSCSVNVTVCPLCDEEVKDKVVTGADEKTIDADACKQM